MSDFFNNFIIMNNLTKQLCIGLIDLLIITSASAQEVKTVTFKQSRNHKAIDVMIGGKPFTTFNYPDSIEKPFLNPIRTATGAIVTRGFPINSKPGDPIDHPHHIGLWFNYENVNGLDFWNNSYAIPASKKGAYGWIKTDKILETKTGAVGVLKYHANWTDQVNKVLLEEVTRFEFSENGNTRMIDRVTTLTAKIPVSFNDVKDGLLGLRLAHELQIPNTEDQKFTDNKGNVTIVKGGTDKIPNGNYLSSSSKTGNDVWGTRAEWCKAFGKIGADSVSIVIIDHKMNPNYPTFWHARGYGLFAANPLGEKVFTNGKTEKNLKLQIGESVTFRYRIIVTSGKETLGTTNLNLLAKEFSSK